MQQVRVHLVREKHISILLFLELLLQRKTLYSGQSGELNDFNPSFPGTPIATAKGAAYGLALDGAFQSFFSWNSYCNGMKLKIEDLLGEEFQSFFSWNSYCNSTFEVVFTRWDGWNGAVFLGWH